MLPATTGRPCIVSRHIQLAVRSIEELAEPAAGTWKSQLWPHGHPKKQEQLHFRHVIGTEDIHPGPSEVKPHIAMLLLLYTAKGAQLRPSSFSMHMQHDGC